MEQPLVLCMEKYCLPGSYNFTLPAALYSYASMTYGSIPKWVQKVLEHYYLIQNSTLVDVLVTVGYVPKLVEQQWQYLIAQRNNPQHLVFAVRQISGFDGWDMTKQKN